MESEAIRVWSEYYAVVNELFLDKVGGGLDSVFPDRVRGRVSGLLGSSISGGLIRRFW